MTQQCKECRFSKKVGFNSWLCRRRAPIAAHDPGKNCGVYPDAFVPRWPLMDGGDWCGEFAAQPNPVIGHTENGTPLFKYPPDAKPHQLRVIDEKADLDDKIARLSAFVAGEVFDGLDAPERLRLCSQLDHMNAYSEVLGRRIEAFK